MPRDPDNPDGHFNANGDIQVLPKRETQESGTGQEDSDPAPLRTIRPFPINPAKIPRRKWLVRRFLLEGHISLIIAPPSAGKSLLTLQLAIVFALGMPWAVFKPTRRLRVLVVNAEDDGDEMLRRLWAAAHVMGVDHGALVDWITIVAMDELPNVVVARRDGRTKAVQPTPNLARFKETVRRLCIDVLIIDPLVETHELDENSNIEIKQVLGLWREVARETRCGLILVHHTPKRAGAMAGDLDASRGASSLAGVVRVAVTLMPMTKEEAEANGILPENRNRFVRLDDAKLNYGLSSAEPAWLIKRTVEVPNGDDREPGDQVGVFEPFELPDGSDLLTTQTLNAILDEIERGVVGENGEPAGELYTNSSRADTRKVDHAFLKVAPALPSITIKRTVDAWLASGLLTWTSYTSEAQRKKRKGFRVVAAKRPGVPDTPVRMPKAPRLPPLDSQAQAYHQAMADDPE